MTAKLHKKIDRILLILILLIQSSMMLYFGNMKQGFHEDEMYSFLMSNWSEWKVGSSAYAHQWRDSSFFSDMLSVTDEELFDMEIVTKNYRDDSHPPLYGYMLKFFSSVFSDSFSKWIGLLPNFVISLAISLLVYLTTKEISNNRWIALVTAAAWAFSVGAMSTYVYIRMYALQVLTCILLAFIHFHYRNRILSGSPPVYAYLYLYLVSLLAILTHFYSLVFCAFLCTFSLVEILYKKAWKSAIAYAISELLALGTALVLWPSTISQLFQGARGAEAVSNLFSFSENYRNQLITVLNKLDLNLLGGYWKYIWPVGIALLAALALKLLLTRKKAAQLQDSMSLDSKHHMHDLAPITICALLIVGYVLFVVKIAPYQSGRYYKCIYPILIITIFSGAHAILRKLINQPVSFIALTLLMISIVTSSHQVQSVNYLFLSDNRKEMLQQYDHLPAVVLNDAGYSGNVFQWLPEFAAHEQVYIARYGETHRIKEAAESKDISDGFLLYAISFATKDDEFMNEVRKYVDVSHYTRLSTDENCDLYYVQLNSTADNNPA